MIFTSNVFTLNTMNSKDSKPRNRHRFSQRFFIIYSLIAVGAMLWCAAFVALPALLEADCSDRLIATGLHAFFSFICHQNPDRSFHITGHSLAVCARCTGIYIGALIGIFAFPFSVGRLNDYSPWKAWLLFALGLNLMEFILSSLNLVSSLIFRAGAGMTLGLWTAFCALFAIYNHIQIRLNWGDAP